MRAVIIGLIVGFLGFTGYLFIPGRPDHGLMGGSDYYYEEPEAGILRILTYNIRNGTGMDGTIDFERIAGVINAINPHVVALQEVDSVTLRAGGVDVLGVLAELTGMFHSYGPAIDFQGGKYGNGILSVQKPVQSSYIMLPGRNELRSLLMVEFDEFIIYGTHLNHEYDVDRHESVKIIDAGVQKAEKPVFLAGDLNDTPGSKTLELLSENWIQLSGNDNTFPADQPSRCIDFIFGIDDKDIEYRIKNQVVVNEPVASDHLPVFVDIAYSY